jgi:hypothetical protein
MVLELNLKFNGRVFSSFFKPGGIVFDIETSWLCVDMEILWLWVDIANVCSCFFFYIAP